MPGVPWSWIRIMTPRETFLIIFLPRVCDRVLQGTSG
jgi:hypothetical protein